MTLVEQKGKKPTYEELSTLVLNGKLKDNLDELITYLKSIKLTPKWYATNAYHVKFKGKIILRFSMNENNKMSLFFTVAQISDLDSIISSISNDMKLFYFNNLRKCTECNPAHNGGKKVTIQGVTYSYCAEPEMRINNPSIQEIEYLKKFIQVRKENISSALNN